MTLRDHKNNCEKLIQLYKEYLLSRGVDAKHRTIAWAITERDELDEDNLIKEIARLGEIVKDLRIRAIINEAYLDEPFDYPEEIIVESTFVTIWAYNHPFSQHWYCP